MSTTSKRPPAASTLDEVLAPFHVAALDAMADTVVALTPDRRIVYVNPAWIAFGVANGGLQSADGEAVGRDLLLDTPLTLWPFYDRLLAAASATGEVRVHDYECSSPARHRTFRMLVHPCPSGALVIVHSLLRETPHDGDGYPPLDSLYRGADDMIVQCANCRRIRRPMTGTDASAQWDWVPAYVAQMPPRTSHALCVLCVQFYYS